MKPLILISNDDGYQAGGINYLIDTLRPVADLVVVAPDGPRSGYSCAITTKVPMTLRTLREEEGLTVMACSGSPVDCVKMAFEIVLPSMFGTTTVPSTGSGQITQPRRMPDLVIGGINHGDNSSVNTYYSGTMGVVTEGALHGVPSVGFSLCDTSSRADFSHCGEWVVRVVEKVLREGLPPFTCLNVNFPKGDILGLRVCRMARSGWVKEIAETQRPGSGTPLYWLTGEVIEHEPEATDTDRWALYHGYAAVTPQTLDSTSYELLNNWEL